MGQEVIEKLVIKYAADVKAAMTGIASLKSAVSGVDSHIGNAAANIRGAVGKIAKAFTIAGAAAVTGLAVGVGKATMTFADFEQAVTNAASVTGLSGEAYDKAKENIAAVAKELGENTVFSAQQAANAMYDLASAGYDVANMTASDLEPFMDIAAATQTGLARSTEIATSALGQFGLGIESAGHVTDVMAKLIGSSKVKIESLAGSMKSSAPLAHSLGMEIEDLGALYGVLANKGILGEVAGTGVKTILASLIDPTGEANAIFEELGLTYDKLNPKTNDIIDVLNRLKEAGIDDAQVMKIFGREGSSAVNALLSDTSGIADLEVMLRNSGGAAEDMATKQLQTLHGSLTLLKSNLEGLMIGAGEKFAPAIVNLANNISESVPRVKELVEEGFQKLKEIIEELSPTFENLKSIASSAKDILTDLFNSITGGDTDTKTFTDTINTLTGALAKVFKWIDEHPTVTKLAATIVGAAVAFSFLLPIVSSIIGVFGILAGVAQTLFLWWSTYGTIMELVGIAIGALGGPITVIIGVIALLAAAWATNMFGIRDKTRTAIDFIKTKWDELKEALGLAWEFAKQTVDDLKIAMGDAVAAFDQLGQIPEILSGLKDSVSGQFRELVDGALEWGGNMIDSFAEGITSKINAAKNAVSNVANTVKDFLGINSPAKKGPLSELMDWGPNLVTTFADGMSSNMGILDTVFAGIVPPTLPQIIPSINKDGIFSSLTDIESEISDAVSRSKELLDGGAQKLKEIVEGLTPTLENLKTGALTVLTGGIYLLYVAWRDNLLGIQDKTTVAVEWVKAHFNDLLKGAFVLLTGGVGLLYVAWRDNLFGIQDRTHEVIEKVKGIFGTLGESLSTMKDDSAQWGKNLVQGFVDGLTSMISKVRNTAEKIADTVKDYLGVHSPAKKGPLSELMDWGPNLVTTFADGISSNMGILDTVFAGMATPAFPTGGLTMGTGRGSRSPEAPGASGQVLVNITIPGMVVREDADLDRLTSRVEKVVGKAVQGVRL